MCDESLLGLDVLTCCSFCYEYIETAERKQCKGAGCARVYHKNCSKAGGPFCPKCCQDQQCVLPSHHPKLKRAAADADGGDDSGDESFRRKKRLKLAATVDASNAGTASPAPAAAAGASAAERNAVAQADHDTVTSTTAPFLHIDRVLFLIVVWLAC